MVMLAKTRKATHKVKRGDRPPALLTASPVSRLMLLDDISY
jgi:hypothetical protein